MDDDLHPEGTEFSLPDDAFADAVAHDPTVHHKPKTAHHSCAWVQGPGAVTLLAEARRDLLQVSALRQEPATEIAFVRVLALPSAKTLLVWPTTEKNGAIEVTWEDGTAHFVASSTLISARMPVESGTRDRYNVHVVKTSKVGPALAIDMRYDLETKLLSKRKPAAKGKAGGPAPAAEPEDES